MRKTNNTKFLVLCIYTYPMYNNYVSVVRDIR